MKKYYELVYVICYRLVAFAYGKKKQKCAVHHHLTSSEYIKKNFVVVKKVKKNASCVVLYRKIVKLHCQKKKKIYISIGAGNR